MRRISLFALALAGTFVAKAQVAADTSATTAPADTTTGGTLTISGYVDAYYQYNFNRPTHVPGLAWENQGRIFDIKHNEFSIGLAQTMFTYETKRSTAVLDLTFGPNAELGNFGNIFGSMIAIKQAYFSYALTDKLDFTIGQYGTHIGYELIDAPLNFHYSLSYLFGNGPFYHTGARLSYAHSDELGFMVGVVNGWDALLDFNDEKSFTAQIGITPNDDFGLYLNWIGGDEKNGLSFPTVAGMPDTINTFANLFDVTSSYQLTDDFGIGLNAAYGNLSIDTTGAESSSWYGAALYLNYYFKERYGLGLRAEHFADPDGVRYFAPTSVNAFTLTADIKGKDQHVSFKPEIRFDVAADDVFIDEDGPKSSQLTVGAGFIYAF